LIGCTLTLGSRGCEQCLRGRHKLDEERQIIKLVEDLDRALIAADVEALQNFLADDYVQYDESGKSSTKRAVIENLSSGSIRYVSMISTGRLVRFLRVDVAIIHGSEDDVVERAGQSFPVKYIYTDIMMRREGKWRMVASQLAKPA
jgi:uncharacterized protein (TIGR02246 family)